MDSSGWNERYSTKEYVWKLAPNQFVEAQFAEMDPGTVVDLAAGEGRNAVWLASRGWRTIAVDFSEVGLDKAQRLAREHDVEIATVLADATTWEPDEPVDAVVIAYLQLPSAVRVPLLRRTATWLKPGGTLFVIAHDQANVHDGHGGPSEVDVCYEPGETAEALSGLEVLRAETVERHVRTDDGIATALDTLVLARRP